MRPNPLWPKAVAEGLGTFAIVFFGCGAIRLGLAPAMASAVFGLTVAVMIYALGHLSGAHFNPAVSLAFALIQRFPLRRVIPYWLSQLAGAFLAVLLLAFLLPGETGFGAVSTHVTAWQTFGWESLLTFFLMLVIVSISTDGRVEGIMAGIAIGGMVGIGSLVGGPVTGAAMNPARYLLPACWEGKLELGWVYVAASLLGAALAALLYQSIGGQQVFQKKNAK